MDLLLHLVVIKRHWRRSRSVCLVPLHVLWMVLQTGDELFYLFALKADLVDSRKQRKPAEEMKNWLFDPVLKKDSRHRFCVNWFEDSLVDHVPLLEDLVDFSRGLRSLQLLTVQHFCLQLSNRLQKTLNIRVSSLSMWRLYTILPGSPWTFSQRLRPLYGFFLRSR